MAEQQYYEGIGRRKTSTARVRLHVGGTGDITVNDKTGPEYFTREQDFRRLGELLTATGTEGRYNITVHVEHRSGRCGADGSSPCLGQA